MKTCLDCHTGFGDDAFYANRTLKDGLDSYCKRCRLERQRQSRIRRGLIQKPRGPNRSTVTRSILCRPLP